MEAGCCASTSSFGMSGVNAHAVFADLPSPSSDVDDLPLRKIRCWLVPPHHRLILRARKVDAGRVEFRVSTSRVPALCDHAVGGRTIMPGTGMLDISFAAADLLGSSMDMHIDVCIMNALIIGEAAVSIECQVNPGIGAARISCAGLELSHGRYLTGIHVFVGYGINGETIVTFEPGRRHGDGEFCAQGGDVICRGWEDFQGRIA